MRPRGVLLTFTEKKDVEFAKAPLAPPALGRVWACFSGGGLPRLQGLLVTRGAGGHPDCGLSSWAPEQPQLFGGRFRNSSQSLARGRVPA